MFELGAQECSQQVGRQIARANINPVIFVHLPTEKPTAIGSFFSEDLGALGKARVVYEQRATFAAGEIFGFVETERRQFTKGAEISVAIFPLKTMCLILYHGDAMPSGSGHYRLHFAANACVVYEKNRFRARGNALFDLALINVQRVRANIHEDRFGAAQDKRVGS